MNIKKTIIRFASCASALALVMAFAPVASAEVRDTKVSAEQQRIKIVERADKEIDRRIDALNNLLGRVSEMKKISDEQKSSTSAMVTAQISELSALKAKIDAGTDLAVLRTDIKSITGSYRIFALVVQQWHILVTADKANTLADSLSALEPKLQAVIDAGKADGKDVSTLETALSDMKAKIAEAKTQIESAKNKVSSLKSDGGDKTKMTANMEALKSARKDVASANQNLKVAREDAKIISRFAKTLKESEDKKEIEKKGKESSEKEDEKEGEDKND